MDRELQCLLAIWDAAGMIANEEEARHVLNAVKGQGNPNPNPKHYPKS